MGRPRVSVTRSDRQGSTLVQVEGEIDLSTVPQLERELLAATEGAGVLLIDLGDVKFIDSTGIGVLFRTSKKVAADGGEMRIVCGPGPVRRVVKVSGLDGVVAVFDDLEAADAV